MRRSVIAVLSVLFLLAAACGSRVPEDEFEAIVIGAGPSEGGLAAGPGGDGLFGDSGVDLSGIGGGDGGGGGGETSGGETTGQGTTGGSGGGAATGGSGGTSGGASGGTTGGTGGSAGTGGSGGGQQGAGSGGGQQGGSGGGQQGGSGGQQGGGGGQNTASDVGVTPTEIHVGMIFSRGGPLGPNVFTPPAQGAAAYFQWLNANGGVNGRTINFQHQCDDAEDPQRNRQCVDRLINQEQVFALVATSTRAYAGAKDVSDAGVPDVGGQPIGNEYWTYPTLFTIRGSEYPQDGRTVGRDGQLYGQTTQFRWPEENLGITNVGAVHYDIPVSASYAEFVEKGAKEEGLQAERYPVQAAFPNFDSVVSNMMADGVDAVWDTLDATGNEKLCEAMQRKNFKPKIKMTTSQGMVRSVGDRLSQVCRDVLFGWAESRPTSDTANQDVATFREVIRRVYGQEYDDNLHQWALEGWAAAKLFVEGVRTMGPNVTRAGLMEWLNSHPSMHEPGTPVDQTFQLGGLLTPTDWAEINQEQMGTGRECLVISRWDQGQRNFVAQTPIPYCNDNVPFVAYAPAS